MCRVGTGGLFDGCKQFSMDESGGVGWEFELDSAEKKLNCIWLKYQKKRKTICI